MNLVPWISTLTRGISISLPLAVSADTGLPTPFSSPFKATKVHSLYLRFPHHGPSPPPWVWSRAPWYRFQTLWDFAPASPSDLPQLLLFSLAVPASNFLPQCPKHLLPLVLAWDGILPLSSITQKLSSAFLFPSSLQDPVVELGHLRAPTGL